MQNAYTCLQCGTAFQRDPSSSKTHQPRFCGRPCYWQNKKQPLRSLEDRFWEKVDKSGDCWMWTAGHHSRGYGVIGLPDGTIALAHRVSWELHFGPIPAGLDACHTCDAKWPPGDITYRGCVKPFHLFLGTNAENQADKVAKGRQARGDRSNSRLHPERLQRGEARYNAVLNETSVRQMRQMYAGGKVRLIDLAEHFDVSLTTVYKVIHRETWAHVT